MNKNDNDCKNETTDAVGDVDFSPFRAAEMVVCAVCSVLGILYLLFDLIGVNTLLSIYTVSLGAITVLRFLHYRKVGKKKWMYLIVGFLAFMTLALAAVCYVCFGK